MIHSPSHSTTRLGLGASLVACVVLFAACGHEPDDTLIDQPRVVDEAGILSEHQHRSISDYLEYVESERKVDYRVAVLGAESADLKRESTALFDRLGVGSRQSGRGVLLVVNVSSAVAKVEVGYELEGGLTDIEASSMISEFLAPYFASDQAAEGVQASIERLVEILSEDRVNRNEKNALLGSGGAGAVGDLLAGVERLTPETEERLIEIMVPQARPEDCVNLEIALMHRGIYYRQVPMYDEDWRKARRPDLPPGRLKAIAREWDEPFRVERMGNHAITYYSGEKGRRWGPQFLSFTREGWIIEASSVARNIVYDYSNQSWYALDGEYPHLALIKKVYDMKPVSLKRRGRAWMIDGFGG